MTYQKMYFSLFNSVTDVIETLKREDKEKNSMVIEMLKNIQQQSEEKYLDLTENLGGKTVDIKAVKKSRTNKVG